MPATTRVARSVLAVTGLVLVGVVLGFVWFAHRRAQNFLTGLPRRLGVNITQETDNFTYSQTLKGKTVFTVRAAKEIQRTDGKVTLRDVGIVVFGRSGDRDDRIHGQEFEYDQKAGILRAVGEAFLDLGGPGGKGKDNKDGDASRVIHVKTIGMVFTQADRSAATDGALEFAAGGLTGSAVGASYDSGRGVVVLRNEVKVNGMRGASGKERPVSLTAARAEMDRDGNVVKLEGPRYVSTGESGSQRLEAERAVVHLTADGTPKDVEAEGHVVLGGDGKGSLHGERLEVSLNAAGQPTDGHLYGGVKYLNETAARRESGRGQDVRVSFDAAGRPVHAVTVGGVEMKETSALADRQLNAEKVELALSGGGKEKLVLRGAVASGDSRLLLVDRNAVKEKGSSSVGVQADVLTGRFGAAGLEGMDGAGKTFVERRAFDAKGGSLAKETSSGETLQVVLKAAAKGRMELSRVAQHGGVAIVRESAPKKAGLKPEIEHASAADAVYDAPADSVVLTGGAQVLDAAGALFADRVQMDRARGDAVAEGAVRVSYAQQAGAEPVHVLAGRAVAVKATGVTQFTAAAGGKVRMWQGSSQVEAPAIDMDKAKKTLVARGDGAGEVKTILAGAEAGAKAGGKLAGGPVRVVSDRMTYADASRQMAFLGGVQVNSRDGVMRAKEAVVFLAPAAANAVAAAAKVTAESGAAPAGRPAAVAPALMGGKVERVVGQGDVVLDEPGRKATGERLVYTAADETYVLTGTKSAPPKLFDETRGTVTGAALRFKSGEDSVVVTGGDAGEGGRVRSEPRVRQ